MNLNESGLILGAGAHVPYNFPTAKGMKVLLRELLSAMNTDFERLNMPVLGGSEWEKSVFSKRLTALHFVKAVARIQSSTETKAYNYLKEFLINFSEAQFYSIDRFLENSISEEEKEMGRIVIGAFLRICEKLYLPGHAEDWIQIIFNDYIGNDYKVESFLERPIKIVTFNYDRFLEASFFKFFHKGMKYSVEKSVELVEKLNILHVYGSLGKFNTDYFSPGYLARDFLLNDIDADLIKYSNIKTINSKIIQERQNAVYGHLGEKCKKIFILGFSFDARNLDVIRPSIENRQCHATNYGLSVSIRNKIYNEFKMSFLDQRKDITCNEMLTDYVSLN